MPNTYLESNSGFYDKTTGSAINLTTGATQFIHGNNRFGKNTGYSSILFTDKLDVNNPPAQPHLAIAYGGLKTNVNFKIKIDLWTNIPAGFPPNVDFYVAYQTSGMIDRLFFPKPFSVTQTSGLTIPITKPTNSGIYYFWIWGIYFDTALDFELYSVRVVY